MRMAKKAEGSVKRYEGSLVAACLRAGSARGSPHAAPGAGAREGAPCAWVGGAFWEQCTQPVTTAALGSMRFLYGFMRARLELR
jgi:hypothetical protein